jgi:hypothetical protein
MRGATTDARRAVYDRSLDARQMERAGKLTSGSVRIERQIEALRGDAFASLRSMPNYRALSAKDQNPAGLSFVYNPLNLQWYIQWLRTLRNRGAERITKIEKPAGEATTVGFFCLNRSENVSNFLFRRDAFRLPA